MDCGKACLHNAAYAYQHYQRQGEAERGCVTDYPGRRIDLQVLRTEPGVFSNLGQSRRADLFVVVEAKGKVPPPGPLEFPMRSDLLFQRPSQAQQGGVHTFGFSGVPDAHAAKSTFSGPGTSSPLSIMSASTWRAIDLTFRTASSSVPPYAITPGRSGIEAKIRPSSSRSISTRIGWISTMTVSILPKVAGWGGIR